MSLPTKHSRTAGFAAALIVVTGLVAVIAWRHSTGSTGGGQGPEVAVAAGAALQSSGGGSPRPSPAAVATCGCAAAEPAVPADRPTTPGTPHPRPARQEEHISAPVPPDFLERILSADEMTATIPLPDGGTATGRVTHVRRDQDGLLLVQGDITAPEAGKFMFQRQTTPGTVGPLAGHIHYDKSDVAYQVRPTGVNGGPMLVKDSVDKVICRAYAFDPPPAGQAPEEAPQTHPTNYPIPPNENGIVQLQSLPGAAAVVYLDFDGEADTFPGWGYINAAPSGATNAQIFEVWKGVAEDYIPFNINVTTVRAVYDAAPDGGRIQVILTPTTTAAPGAGGVAYVGSFNYTGHWVCWSFYTTGKGAVEVVSHEVGHTLGLSHDGRITPAEGYYGGNNGWAPIMGVGYSQTITQFSKGEYPSANNTEDDLDIIVSNNNAVDYRVDDHGATYATATWLDIASGESVANEGTIETRADEDSFRFTTTGGNVALNINNVTFNPNLDIKAEIVSAAGTVIATSDSDSTTNASFSALNLAAGDYFLRVSGVGKGDLSTGYSDYGSLGSYLISGNVNGGVAAEHFTLAENSANTTTVGSVAPRVSHGAGTPAYAISSGNTGGTFAINPATGAITVANGANLDYETLSTRWDDPASFELFVSITDSLGVATESIRTVVTIQNVNEAPVLAPLAPQTILDNLAPGSALATASAVDPDREDYISFSIAGGNTGNAFAIDSATGAITVAGPLDFQTTPAYTLTVRATDHGTPVRTADRQFAISLVGTAGAIVYGFDDGTFQGWQVISQGGGPNLLLHRSWADLLGADPCLTTSRTVPGSQGTGFTGDNAHSTIVVRSPVFTINPGATTIKWNTAGGHATNTVDPGTGTGPYPAGALGVVLVEAATGNRILSSRLNLQDTLAFKSFDVSALAGNATNYYLEIVDRYSGGWGYGEWDDFIIPGALLPPSIPAGLTATAGNAKVLLTWTASSGASAYKVKRSATDGGPYTRIATTTATSYRDTTAVDGTTYHYVVAASNATADSADSAQASATPGMLPPSLVSYWSFDESAGGTGTAYDQADGNDGSFNGTVTRTIGLLGTGAALFSHDNGINVGSGTGNNFSVTDGITLEMLVKPGAALGGNTYEELFRKEDGNSRILLSFQESATILALGLNIGGTYAELDMPLNGSNNGAHGVYLDAPSGGLPAGAVALRDGNAHHIVGLYDKASGLKAIYVDGFVAHSQNFAAGTAIVTGGTAQAYIGSTVSSEPFDGIIDEVAFYNAALSAAEVARHYANVQAFRNYFTAASYNITATAGTGGSISPSGVRRVAENSTPTYTITPGTGYVVSDVVLDGTTHLGAVTTYTFAPVTAAHTIAATFAGVPPATPTNLTATAGNAKVLLAWTTSYGATGYKVKRSTTSGGPYTMIATTTATSHLDTTAVNGTTYYYVVSATNATGESADTAQAGATPATATATGVAVGSSTLISTPDYSDTWTIGTGATVPARVGYSAGAYPPSASVLAVENTYGNPARTWEVPGSLVTDSAGIANGTPTFPGGSGAGSATGFTQAGIPGGGFAFGMAYDIRSNYVVQWDAVQTADWVGVVTGVDTTSFLASNNLLVYFKPTGSGDGSIHLYSNGIGDYSTGIATGVTTGTWNNYAVQFDLTNKVLGFYTNQTLLGQIDLTTFAGGGFSSLAGAATTNDRIGLAVSSNGANRLWTDNFQVGLPPASSYAITATAGTGGSISPSGVVSVESNSTPTYTITPDTGYAVADVVLDGTTSLGAVTTYTFAPVAAAHTIAATFVAVPPATPTDLTATAGDAKVLLMWPAASGATGYKVKRSATNGGPYTTIGTTTATHYFDTTAANGTPCYYVVSATNATGESAHTAQAAATPGTPPPAGVIYTDGFNGSASGNLAGQTTTVGGGTWIGSSAWKADGSAGTVVGANGDAMYLPLAVAANAKYTLSLTTTMATAGWWCSLGFANFASPPSGTEFGPWVSGNRWGSWMINGATGLGQTFLQNTDGLVNYGDLGHDLKIVLDTASTGWTAEYFVNGASIRGPVALGVSSANYVMFAKNGGTGTVDNFELSVAPTVAPSGYATWASANGLDPAHPEAVGHDGLTNLIIYALDLRTDGTNGSPGTLTGNMLSFTKRPEAVANGDVTYAIEVSTDLGATDPWHVTTTGVTEVVGPPSTISIDFSALGGTRYFTRLKVTRTP